MDNRITVALVSAAIGAFILYWFFWPEFTTNIEIVEVRKTDTVYVTLTDTVYRTKPVTRYLRDTVYITETDTLILPIRSFSETFPNQYGSITAFGETVGELLKINLATDLTIPEVTNTVTRTETITITEKPRGLYLGLGVNQQLTPFGSVHYLDNRYIFTGSYSLDRVVSVGVGRKLF